MHHLIVLRVRNLTWVLWTHESKSQILSQELRVKESRGLSGDSCCCSCSVAQSCPTLCDPMDCSTPGLPVHHQLPELAQTHIHWVGDAIQPSHPLLSPSPPALNLSQHQGLFKWASSLHQVAKVLEFQLQLQSYQWILRTGWISLQSKGLSRVFSNTTVQKHQFFGSQLSL